MQPQGYRKIIFSDNDLFDIDLLCMREEKRLTSEAYVMAEQII